ncbi:hypothetical protein H4582DRAFT_1822106, partial [Lactarius indigo]
PLGYLNPWLYANGFVALDGITSDSNPGCNTDGFSAVAGWDPVNGTECDQTCCIFAFDAELRKSLVSGCTDEGI